MEHLTTIKSRANHQKNTLLVVLPATTVAIFISRYRIADVEEGFDDLTSKIGVWFMVRADLAICETCISAPDAIVVAHADIITLF